MNPADKYARKTFSQIESQVSKQYREAYKDILKKMADFTRRHKAKDKQMQRDLKNGKITQEQYASWLRGQVFIGQQWQSAKASIDATIKNVMNEASSLTHQKSIDVFVNNANYTAYQIEKDHGFTGGINFDIYDRKTVSRLMLEDPELLPRRKDINGNKLEAWNTKTISNCIFQAITQGESIDELSKRIARDTSIDAGRSSLLYARTAMTGAQNAGRIERMKEAQSMGIKVQKQWMSTLDSRTRDSHRDMDGEIAGMDDEFSNGLEYPGDPNGPGREVYNCRCTLIYHYPGYSNFANMERTAYYEEGDPEYDPRHRNYETVKGMNYEQWVNYKQDQIRQRYIDELTSSGRVVVDGKDITDSWKWDPDEYDFAIDDVLHAQGFDGLPRVVSAEEFDQLYTGEQPLLLRTFSAPDQETLDAYDDMLKNGKFYVDCSDGGAQYGQGMYTAGVYGKKGSATAQKQYEGAMDEMRHYQTIKDRDGMVSKIETMTLDPSARIVNLSDLKKDPKYKAFTKKRDTELKTASYTEQISSMRSIIQSAKYILDEEKTTMLSELDRVSEMVGSGKINKVYNALYGITKRGSSMELGREFNYFSEDSKLTELGRCALEISFKYGGLRSAREIATESIYAAAMGYDAINARGHGSSGSYTIVLNRTKLIIIEGD